MPKRILVVDDDLQTVKLVGLILDRRGYDIVAAREGEAALEKARTEKPDLVILDIMMPDMDGYEVCRQLRADPSTANLPILMFTAKAGLQDKVDGFESGADDFLIKPIHPKELLSHVETLLQRFARPDVGRKGTSSNIVGFLGSKGGAGTTTLTVNAAVALALQDGAGDDADSPASELPVVMAETRMGMATASFQLGLAAHDGLATLRDAELSQIDAQMVEAQLLEHKSGLLVLSGTMDPTGVGEALTPDCARAVVRHLADLASYLLLDLGTGLDELNRTLLPLCRRVMVVIEPDNAALVLAEKLVAQLNQSLHIPRHRIGLVLVKRSRSAASFNKQTIEERLGHTLMGMIPPAPELAFQSAKEQIPMVQLHLESLVVRQVNTFVEDLIEEL